MTWIIRSEAQYMKKNHEAQSIENKTLNDDLKKKIDKKIK
jgi:hypothetical protein